MAAPPPAVGPQGADAAEGRLAVRVEIVEVEGLAGAPGPLRGALTVCGHPVYVGEGPLTDGAVRLAQLPPAADLAVALLSAAGDAVLVTAPLPLCDLRAGAADVEAEDLPRGSRACQAWLPLLPPRADPAAAGAARVLAAVVFEGGPPASALPPRQRCPAREEERPPPSDPVPPWPSGTPEDSLARGDPYHDELLAASAPGAPAPPRRGGPRTGPPPPRGGFAWPRLDARPDGAPVLDAPEMPPGDLSLEDLLPEGRAQQVPRTQARARAALGAAGALAPCQGPEQPEGQLVQEALGRLYAQLLEAASGAAVQSLLGALSALLPQLGGGCGDGAARLAAAAEVEMELDVSRDASPTPPPSRRHGLAQPVAVM